MKTQKQLIAKFGDPSKDNITFERAWMQVYKVPADIRKAIPVLPGKIYLNRLIADRLDVTFRDLIFTELHTEIKTWDGCFNIRKKKGLSTLSLHAFGLAVDLNAAWNGLGKKVAWSDEFIHIWRVNGWTCGADWKGSRIDGMHFQWDAF